MSSLSQDELGHAAALYGLLGDLTRRDPDAIAYDRAPAEYRHARLLDHGRGDWAMTIARRYLYETADAVRLEALADGSWPPLADLVGQAPPRGALPRHAHHVVAGAPGHGVRRAARSAGGRARDPRSGRRDRVHADGVGGLADRCGRPGATDGRPRARVAGSPRPAVRAAAVAARSGDDRARNADGPITASPSGGCGASSRPSAPPTRVPHGDRDRPIGAGRARGARRGPGPGDPGPVGRRPRHRPPRRRPPRRDRGRHPAHVRRLSRAGRDPRRHRRRSRCAVRPAGPRRPRRSRCRGPPSASPRRVVPRCSVPGSPRRPRRRTCAARTAPRRTS